MKKRIIAMVALAVILTAGIGFTRTTPSNTALAADYVQPAGFSTAKVTTSYLNVRQGPSTSYPIVCVLKYGDTVKVLGKIGGWYIIHDMNGKGCVGVVSGLYIKSTGASNSGQKSPTTSPTPQPSTKPSPSVPTQTVTPSKSPVQSSPGASTSVTTEDQKLLDLVNNARTSAGVGKLQFDTNLMKVARLKAQDMVANNYFSHQSPTYGSPFDMMRQFGISYKTAGENIAGNQTVDAAFNAWMNSPGHKANILNSSYNFTGVGIVSGSSYGKIFVQQFIGR